ncbi:50S ribosomal subunit protein L16 [Candidatus Nasuia deltocephalinicola]|uniref:50S ribosomal protein L16 n=1 Tax=Candidatus Nasuia deltocephalincola TaxID=1160784 RepID=A0A975A436_9PROT|nr:50S ribosomal protein L16 [Candidatus Nasuia deltocephalinicola]BEH03943.1 50S ribosomal subunit protein L16 [Candidatus Nasuia deltocephalinicola]
MFGNKKYLKNFRGKNNGFSKNGNTLCYGDYGLRSISWGNINSNQIESGRKVISRNIKKSGKLWIRIFPDRSYTKKPVDVRMGNGKGDIIFYVFYIKPGKIIYEIKGLNKIFSLKILKLASFKLPLKTSFIY